MNGFLQGQYLNFDKLVFFFARLAHGHKTIMSSFQQNKLQKYFLSAMFWFEVLTENHQNKPICNERMQNEGLNPCHCD